MPVETITLTEPHVLVVEGEDERRFIRAFLAQKGLPDIQILPVGGKQQLRGNLKALVRAPGFSQVAALGVARDADDNPRAAFESVQGALRDAGLAVPHAPLRLASGTPRTVVMILPDASTPGALEDLCMRSVASDLVIPCLDEYVKCLTSALQTWRDTGKARVQAFLASRPKPGLRLGEAAQAGHWGWGSSAFQQIDDFLTLIRS